MSRGLAVLTLLAALVTGGCGGEGAPESAPPATALDTPPTSPGPGTTPEPKPGPKAPTATRVEISVRDGRIVGGIVRRAVREGQEVVLVVTADVADHVHLHGYDLMVDVRPGTPAKLRFAATVPGRFEVELEELGLRIADLQVRP